MFKAYGYTGLTSKDWIDIEFPQLSKDNFKIGYEPEYIEKKAINGFIYRKLLGYRLVLSWKYPYLLKEEREKIFNILRYQYNSSSSILSYVATQIKVDISGNALASSQELDSAKKFEGDVVIDYDSQQTRFCYSDVLNDYIWSNWSFTAKSTELKKL